MTNEEKAEEICSDYNYTQFLNDGTKDIYTESAVLYMLVKMAQWKEQQLKEVCKKCEQHIIDSGKTGCAFRSLGNEYCWRD